jgi:phage/plasmid primase-like uncharacterized protein
MPIDRYQAEQKFKEAMRQHGLALAGELNADGQIYRCNVDGKGPAGKNDGAYLLHVHADYICGGYQNWTSGQGWQKWSYKRPGWKPTPQQQREIEQAIKQARRKGEKELAEARLKARMKAKEMWAGAVNASASHPYARRKQLEPHGLRSIQFENGNEPLLVPMYNAKRKLVNLQFIHADGRKHGLTGGRQKDTHFWLIRPDKVDSKTICIGTGWATTKTVYHATEHAIICAFNDGNLESVANWVRGQYPEHEIIVCADDDWKTADNPGMSKGCEAARAVGGKVAKPVFGEQRKDAWTDFNDMLTSAASRDEGLEAVGRAIAEAVPPDEIEPDDNDEQTSKLDDDEGMKQADVLVQLACMSATLFHNSEGNSFADLNVDGHRETWPIKSEGFKKWLVQQYYRATKSAPSPTAKASALELLEAKARFDGDEHEVCLRVAEHDGKIYLDLADKQWRVVEIDADGWRVASNAPVRFQRRKGLLPLPVPVAGGSIKTLRKYLNIKKDDEDDFRLVIAWLLIALNPRGPYPVLSVTGESGTTKSSLLKILRGLVDPNVAPLRAPPRDERDLFIAANNSHILAYDNLSWLPEWLSDGLSRIATEGSFSTRMLYTDDEERLFNAMRPIMLGAVDDIVVKGDLAERIIALLLSLISGKRRRSQLELWQEFERDRPGILGALLDAVAHGLRRLEQTRIKLKQQELPRMADFVVWVTACGDGLLWDEGEFAAAYADNRAKVNENVVQGDSLTAAVLKLMEVDHGEWSGTMSALLDRLNAIAGDNEIKQKHWPSSAARLGRRIRTIASPLRRRGIEIAWEREGNKGDRIVSIRDRADRTDGADSNPQASGSASRHASVLDQRPATPGESKEVRKLLSEPSVLSASQPRPQWKHLRNKGFSSADSADSTDSNPPTSSFPSALPSAKRRQQARTSSFGVSPAGKRRYE